MSDEIKQIREALESGRFIDKTWHQREISNTIFPSIILYEKAFSALSRIASREAKLREALEWYANINHYKRESAIFNPGRRDFIAVMADYGGYARGVLREEGV